MREWSLLIQGNIKFNEPLVNQVLLLFIVCLFTFFVTYIYLYIFITQIWVFYRKIDNSFPYETLSGIRARYFHILTSEDIADIIPLLFFCFLSFLFFLIFETLKYLCNKKIITRLFEDMRFIFSRKKDKLHTLAPPCNILYRFTSIINACEESRVTITLSLNGAPHKSEVLL